MKLHTPEDVCQILDIGKTTFYKFLKDGQLSAIKVGKLTRVPDSAIQTFIDHAPAYKTTEALND